MFDSLLSAIAPHLCCSCGKTGAVLCDNCKYDISLEYFEGCLACGSPAAVRGVCKICITPYSRAWCVGERSGVLRDVIDGYKFYNNYAAHRDLASLLSGCIGVLPPECVIVPVPTVSSHIRQRGYDHTLLLAKRLAKLQDVAAKSLLRRKTSSTQRGQGRKKRLSQARKAFGAKGKLDQDMIYLLVDDVVTTGSTLFYAAQALRDAGAGDVWVAAIARQPLD
jgi:ComF family protein